MLCTMQLCVCVCVCYWLLAHCFPHELCVCVCVVCYAGWMRFAIPCGPGLQSWALLGTTCIQAVVGGRLLAHEDLHRPATATLASLVGVTPDSPPPPPPVIPCREGLVHQPRCEACATNRGVPDRVVGNDAKSV